MLKAGGNFEDLAERLSQDRNSAARGERMGYILANQYPYAFEEAAFSLSEGGFREVVESRWAIIYLRVESVVPRVERCRPHIS